MRKRVLGFPGLAEARAHASESLTRLPVALRRLEAWRVRGEISAGIRELAAELDRSVALGQNSASRV